MSLGRMMQGFITVIVGVSLIPTVADTISLVVNPVNGTGSPIASNLTGSAGSILELTTLFFALGIMVAGIGIAVGGLADIGLI